MTADEIIAEALIPDTHSVFVLGSFEQRVTVFAQQVRALNLVDAILSRGLLQNTGSVAIVGGGAAGITAASRSPVLRPTLRPSISSKADPTCWSYSTTAAATSIPISTTGPTPVRTIPTPACP
jgi:hypothetical protein